MGGREGLSLSPALPNLRERMCLVCSELVGNHTWNDSINLLNSCVPEMCSFNWASEVSPTLGCSIEISCDMYMYVCMYCM